ncbi:MAG: hypothetical protein FWC78_09440, partial [Defluviitaleaceae bacterium]|nr:hypothetical protein [Defluviitaleaceae bacterium]
MKPITTYFPKNDIFSENGTVWYHILGKMILFSSLKNYKTPKIRGFIAAPPKNIRIERGKFFARRGAENRRALAVRKVFSDEGLW